MYVYQNKKTYFSIKSRVCIGCQEKITNSRDFGLIPACLFYKRLIALYLFKILKRSFLYEWIFKIFNGNEGCFYFLQYLWSSSSNTFLRNKKKDSVESISREQRSPRSSIYTVQSQYNNIQYLYSGNILRPGEFAYCTMQWNFSSWYNNLFLYHNFMGYIKYCCI